MEPNPVWLVSLQEEEIGTQTQREDRAKAQGEAAIYKPGREGSEETYPTNTLILDLWAPELWERDFCWLGHPECGIVLWQPEQTPTDGQPCG